jgi:hypothetical protein
MLIGIIFIHVFWGIAIITVQPHSITNLRQRKNVFLLGLAITFLALFIYSSIIRPLLEPLFAELPRIPGVITNRWK